MVPRDQRIRQAYNDPRPMNKRSMKDLYALADNLRIKVDPDIGKEELAGLLEAEALNHVPMRSLITEQGGTAHDNP